MSIKKGEEHDSDDEVNKNQPVSHHIHFHTIKGERPDKKYSTSYILKQEGKQLPLSLKFVWKGHFCENEVRLKTEHQPFHQIKFD